MTQRIDFSPLIGLGENMQQLGVAAARQRLAQDELNQRAIVNEQHAALMKTQNQQQQIVLEGMKRKDEEMKAPWDANADPLMLMLPENERPQFIDRLVKGGYVNANGIGTGQSREQAIRAFKSSTDMVTEYGTIMQKASLADVEKSHNALQQATLSGDPIKIKAAEADFAQKTQVHNIRMGKFADEQKKAAIATQLEKDAPKYVEMAKTTPEIWGLYQDALINRDTTKLDDFMSKVGVERAKAQLKPPDTPFKIGQEVENKEGRNVVTYRVTGYDKNGMPIKERIAVGAKDSPNVSIYNASSEQIDAGVKMFAEGRATPDMISKRQIQAYLPKLQAEYPGFDMLKAITNYKSMANQNFIRAKENVNSVLETADMVKQYALALKNGNNQLANEWANKWAAFTGNPAPTNWRTVSVAMAQEFNRGYSDSVVNPEGRFNKEIKNLAEANSPAQLIEGLDANVKMTKIRGNAIDRMRQPYSWEEVRGEKPSAKPGSSNPSLNSGGGIKIGRFTVEVQ